MKLWMRPALLLLASAVFAAILWQVLPRPFHPIRVNCGGTEFKDPKTDDLWVIDEPYVKKGRRAKGVKSGSIKLTPGSAPKEIYATLRREKIDFRFTELPVGRYEVRLHFAEPREKDAHRRMDFWFNEIQVLQHLNLHEVLNRRKIPYVFSAVVEVRHDRSLRIRGSKSQGDDVFLCGIEIHQAAPDAPLAINHGELPELPTNHAASLREFAGGPVRLVWTRAEDADDFYSLRPESTLWGYDSEDGRGERCILSKNRPYAKPLFADQAHQIVFTDPVEKRCYAVHWDGSGLRELAEGYAGEVFHDSITGIDWVYIRTGWGEVNMPLIRLRLDDPAIKETVWNLTPVGHPLASHMQISGDGRWMTEGLPWPVCGLVDLPGQDFDSFGDGCWPGVAPDASGRFFRFIGTHKSLHFYDQLNTEGRLIHLDSIPGWPNRKLYHPRWSNHARFLTATAPQRMPETELYLGRFDESFQRIDGWFRITYNRVADFWGDAWLAHSPQIESSSLTRGPVVSRAKKGFVSGMVLHWENARATNAVRDAAGKISSTVRASLLGPARWNRWFGAELRGGSLQLETLPVTRATKRCLERKELTFSLLCRPSSTSDEPGTWLSWQLKRRTGDEPSPWLSLVQEGQKPLSLHWSEGDETQVLPIAPIRDAEWQIVTLSISQSDLALYLNGSLIHQCPFRWPLSGINESIMFSGPWHGEVEDFQLLEINLPAAAVDARDTHRISEVRERKAIEPLVVTAELIYKSSPADAAEIAPYTRSLAEQVFEVKRVNQGTLTATRIIVLQWSLLNRIPVENLLEEGDVVTLQLEPEHEHPELEGENRTSDHLELDLPVFLDLGP